MIDRLHPVLGEAIGQLIQGIFIARLHRDVVERALAGLYVDQ